MKINQRVQVDRQCLLKLGGLNVVLDKMLTQEDAVFFLGGPIRYSNLTQTFTMNIQTEEEETLVSVPYLDEDFVYGTYFGYPLCCIHTYIGVRKTEPGMMRWPNDYRPCRYCQSQPIVNLLKEITTRRQHPEQFPTCNTVDQGRLFHTIIRCYAEYLADKEGA